MSMNIILDTLQSHVPTDAIERAFFCYILLILLYFFTIYFFEIGICKMETFISESATVRLNCTDVCAAQSSGVFCFLPENEQNKSQNQVLNGLVNSSAQYSKQLTVQYSTVQYS